MSAIPIAVLQVNPYVVNFALPSPRDKMTFGQDWGTMLPGASKEESRKIFKHYSDTGGNFIDTANMYQNGTSEKFLGELITADRNRYVLATKYTLTTNPNDPNAGGNHRKNMYQSIEASLKRLNTSYIDLLWVHIWDPLTPIEEVMRSLDDLVRAGKVMYIGISDTPAWIVSQANTLAQLRGWTSFVGIQIQYSLIERTAERELLPMAKSFDIGVTAWSPLGGGVLTGKYNPVKLDDKSSESKRLHPDNQMSYRFLNERNLSISKVVQEISKEISKTPSQVALNWIIQQNESKGVIIPIVGARTKNQITDNLESINFKLDHDQLKRLDEISSIELGFPHDMFSQKAEKEFIFGNSYSLIDNHRK